jgi:hypothetical protein
MVAHLIKIMEINIIESCQKEKGSQRYRGQGKCGEVSIIPKVTVTIFIHSVLKF